ncbi:histidine kinase [Arenimonas daejeonensis]|uniref:sensor histidine kinase n=1 Tax=Arenimonas daejeonensis TaxID=370777 RepID=UPI0031B84084
MVALLYCWLITAVAHAFFDTALLDSDADWWNLGIRTSGISLTVGLLGLAAFDNYWRGRLHALRAKQSELDALQARIRPHFLFNTLNTGAALVHARPGKPNGCSWTWQTCSAQRFRVRVKSR